MNFEYSAKTKDLQNKLHSFMDKHIYPNGGRRRTSSFSPIFTQQVKFEFPAGN